MQEVYFYSILLGIRPTMLGFTAVEIAPQFAPLTQLRGKMAHPQGFIYVDFSRDGAHLSGTISLPKNVMGVLK